MALMERTCSALAIISQPLSDPHAHPMLNARVLVAALRLPTASGVQMIILRSFVTAGVPDVWHLA